MEGLNVSEKEILNTLLNTIDMLFRIKYSDNMEKSLEREIEFCKVKLKPYSQVDVSDLENKYK